MSLQTQILELVGNLETVDPFADGDGRLSAEDMRQLAVVQLRRFFNEHVESDPLDDTPNKAERERLKNLIKQHEDVFRTSYASNDAERIFHILAHYKNAATESLRATNEFKKDLLTGLRALSMVAESVGDAGTHSEKNVRLRGLVGIIETIYQKVERYDMSISRHSYAWDSVFRSDYPAREYIERIRQLEDEIVRLKHPQEEAE